MAGCPACGFVSVEGARFCAGCGARLVEVAPTGGRERKTVSVLFCDLVGFTAASDGADPEDVQAALTPYHARARLEIERFGGTVEKFIGDAVMAAFGAPAVHEDDPERAVRAGLRLLDAVKDLNEQHGLDLMVRIGIATGAAVVSTGAHPERGEGMLAGDVVNTAARLQTAASPGTVVVGEGTWRATRTAIEFEELNPVTVKGKADPVPLWRAIGARSRVGEALASTSSDLVGRKDELELLQRTFNRCVRESSVQLATIVGEPGVGKSRLVQELSGWIDQREELITWRQGRCLPYGEAITFWALGQVVKAQMGILETDSRDLVQAKLTDGLTASLNDTRAAGSQPPATAQIGWMTARLAPLVGLPGAEASREELFSACQKLLEAIAATGPLVVVLEDLHWADQVLLEFCEHLLEWVTDVPMMIVATARPELFDKAPTWGSGQRNTNTIGLSRLTDAETALLVTGLLGSAVLPAQTHAELLQRAGGNPLYAEEYIRMLADKAQLPDQATVKSPSASDDLELVGLFPDSVQAIIAARLDTLPTQSKALLLDAAVIGQTFWSGAVATLADRPEPDVRATLHELSRRDYLRPARVSTLADQAEYTFGHALINEVAYEQIPRTDRAAKHRRAAEWTVELAGDDPGSLTAVIAHHYHQAHVLTTMSGRTSGDDRRALADEARRWHERAAEHALALDPAPARTHYESALDLTPEGHADRPRLLTSLGMVLRPMGEFALAESILRDAEAAYAAQGEPLGAASAALHRSLALSDLGRGSESHALLDQCTEALEQHPPGPELVQAYSARAVDHMICGRDRQSIDWADKALLLAKDIQQPERVRDSVVRALMARAMSRLELGEPGGEQDSMDVLAMAADYNLTDRAIAMYGNLGVYKTSSESSASALEYYDKSIDLARERGRHPLAASMSINKAGLLSRIGRWDEALELAERSIAALSGEEDSRDLVLLRLLVVGLQIERGVTHDPEQVEELMAAARRTGEPGPELDAARTRFELSLIHSDARARDLSVQGLESLLSAQPDAFYGESLTDIARMLAPTGSGEVVERLIAAAPVGMPSIENNVACARAILLEEAGELEAALELYEAGANGWRDYGYPFEEAQALLGIGRCSARLQRPDVDALERAREIFARLGAVHRLAETEGQLSAVSSQGVARLET